jgi:nucleotide-binding universal stress UspA family protein
MNVLLGVDLSPHAEAALNFVLRMAWTAETTLVVVSVVHLPFMAYGEAAAFAPDDLSGLYETLEEAHREVASRSARRLKDAGLLAEARLVHGDPREALIEEARRHRADLIVVGSHGRSGLTKLVMGSVASYVVTHAPCSVLVVKMEGRPA